MPTHDPRLALDVEAAPDVVARTVMPDNLSGDGLGLEIEFLPVTMSPPVRRLPLDDDVPSVRGVLAERGGTAPGHSGPAGTTLTVEPGGQVEVATACCATVDALLAQASAATRALATWFDRDDVALVAAGIDLWHDVEDVAQQLRDPRYPAMAAYFASRGPAGATMMRHTCALQLTVDLGIAQDEIEERWLLANLLAPVATATFANSPSPDGAVRSRRSVAWQQVDITRTGVPAGLIAGRGTLVDQVVSAALRADVLLVRTGVDTSGTVTAAEPGVPGWSFADWMRRGHTRYGWPTSDDLRYHLTTMFHEVRARGPIEIRSIDALPYQWRAVPVVLYAGALFDATARARILEVLIPHRTSLPELLGRAARSGVADPSLCALAVEAWSFALAGARRLPGVASTHLAVAEDFLDRFTLRGRCPADELSEEFRRSPARAMDLVREPTPATTRSHR